MSFKFDPLFGLNATDVQFFCGVSGLAPFGDCAREIFAVTLFHGAFFLIGWSRFMQLFYEPKVFQFFAFGFFCKPSVGFIYKAVVLMKIICLIFLIFFVDAASMFSIFFTDVQVPRIFYIGDFARMFSWVLFGIISFQELLRNLNMWWVSRVFVVVTFFTATLTKYLDFVKDYIFAPSTLDIVQHIRFVIFHFYFFSHFVLAVLAIAGIVPIVRRFTETVRLSAKEKTKLEKKKQKKSKFRISFFDLFRLFTYGWYLIVPGLVFAFIQGFSVIQIAENAGAVLGNLDSKTKVWELAITFLIYVPLASFATILQMSFLGIGGEITVDRVRSNLFRSLTRQDMSFFSDYGTGYIIARLTSDCDVLGIAFTVSLSAMAPPAVELILGVIRLFYISFRLSVLANALLLLTFVSTTIRSKLVTQRYAVKYSDAKAKLARKATECITGFSTVKTFGNDKYESKEFKHLLHKAFIVGATKEFLESIFESIELFMNNFIISICIMFGATLVFGGGLKEDGLTSFTTLGISTIRAFLSVVRVLPDFYNASGSLGRVFCMLNRKSRLNLDKGKVLDENQFQGAISIKNVTFAYPKREDETGDLEKKKTKPGKPGEEEDEEKEHYVLKNINLEIPAGSSCAFVGSSGSGKSTILSLLMRFYDVQKGLGSIELDGVDIREIQPRWLLKNLAVCEQMPILFDETIEKNIKYSCVENKKEYNNEEEFWKAVELANCRSVLEAHEEGKDFIVGELGGNLSGGMRQRVSIARCVRKKPKILILDEVTSALDPQSESLVMQGVQNFLEHCKCTTLFVAHRLHTIMNVDKIVVMHKGEIVEVGKHDELMEKNGLYKSLFLKQQILAAKEASQLKTAKNSENAELDNNEDLILREIMEGDAFIRQDKLQKLLQLENVLQFVEANDCFDREELKIMIRQAHDSLAEMKLEADPYNYNKKKLMLKNDGSKKLSTFLPHSTDIEDDEAIYNGMDDYDEKLVELKDLEDEKNEQKNDAKVDEILNNENDEESDNENDDQKPLIH